MGARAVRPMARRPSGGHRAGQRDENHAPPSQTGGAAARAAAARTLKRL